MHQQVIPPGRPGRPFNDRQLDFILGLLAREQDFVFLESARLTPENSRSLLFLRPRQLLILTPDTTSDEFFAAMEAQLRQGRYLAGWFAYEFGYLLEPRLRRLLPPDPPPLAVLGVYHRPLVYDHATGLWQDDRAPSLPTGDNQAPAGEPPASRNDPGLEAAGLERNLNGEQYRRNIELIKEYIAAGDTYQVNYTLKQQLPCRGSATALYAALRRNQRVSYAALLNLAGQSILSLSPELFLRREGSRCTVRPMKGTSRRGLTPEEDAARAADLARDEKNRSENVMIVDLLRNDLGRICRPGTVHTRELFTVESYETLHQMTSTVQGELRGGLREELREELPGESRGELQQAIGLKEIFQALFPCGSVTGAPKLRTMEIIHELEKAPRGVYTGAIGFIGPEQEMVFNVPIRTITLQKGRAGMGIGSGIVYDSEPSQEWRECKLKGDFLSRPASPFVLLETMLWQPGHGYALLELHLERLLASARRLGFVADEQEVRQLLADTATVRAEPGAGRPVPEAQRVRLTLARDGTLELTHVPFHGTPCFHWPASAMSTVPGVPGSPDDHGSPYCSGGTGEARRPATGDRPAEPSAPGDTEEQPLPTVIIADTPIDPGQPLLYHKTSRRELYDRQREKALAAGHLEVLFVNTRGELTEGAISNLFVRLDDRLVTPPVSAGLLDGVLRRHLRRQPHPQLAEETLRPADLAGARAVFIGNSLRGLTRVRVAG